MTEQFGTFDFGLNEEQEECAARLHRGRIVDVLFQGRVGYRVFDAEMNRELPSRLESSHDVLRTFTDGIELPVRRPIEEFPRHCRQEDTP